MVPPDDHDLKRGVARERVAQEAVKARCGGDRWVRDVENIPGHDDCVNLELCYLIEQPHKKRVVLLLPVVTVELLADVPVRCVQETHCARAW